MKGFKDKSGKFRPTGTKSKSSLNKSDLRKKETNDKQTWNQYKSKQLEQEKEAQKLFPEYAMSPEAKDKLKMWKRNEESLDEEDPHEIPQIILDQLQASTVNGFPFFAYTGIKGFVMLGNDSLMLKDIPRNPNHISSVTIIYDEGRDLYNMVFQKGKFPKNVPVKELDGVFVDQLTDIIVDTMGVR